MFSRVCVFTRLPYLLKLPIQFSSVAHSFTPRILLNTVLSSSISTAFAMSSSTGHGAADLSPPLLVGRADAYDGVILDDPSCFPSNLDGFEASLQASLAEWRRTGRRGIWLKIPRNKAFLLPIVVEAGFTFHHAEPEYVMLTIWLPKSENKLPPSASHQVGVGAFVFDEKHRSVLVVREKSGPLAGKGVWKIPTGLVMQGEDITEAAVREVEEETGVKARFAAVLAMRQAHGVAFSKSDLFFLVALKPAPGASESPLKPQEDEIEEASWLPLEEYRSQAFTLSRPLLVRLLDRCVAWVEGKYKGLEGAKIESGFSDRQDLLFFGEEEEGRSSMGGQDAWIGVSNDSV